jgi:hypothetical protein
LSNWLRSEDQSDSLDNLTRPNIRTWLASLTERNDGVRDLVHRRGVQAGIDDLQSHRFRHAFAHDFLVGGGQERA